MKADGKGAGPTSAAVSRGGDQEEVRNTRKLQGACGFYRWVPLPNPCVTQALRSVLSVHLNMDANHVTTAVSSYKHP